MSEHSGPLRIVIDHKRCLKSGQCAYMQSELFRMNDDGAPVVIVAEVHGDQVALAADAIEMCPGQAIALVQKDKSISA
jgi:ferredoxin